MSDVLLSTGQCGRHGESPHAIVNTRSPDGFVSLVCLTCELERIAITLGGKAPGYRLAPNPKTTPDSLDRARRRYAQLYSLDSIGDSDPGSTAQQRLAARIYAECGSQAETARRMAMSRAGVHGLLKRAGVI